MKEMTEHLKNWREEMPSWLANYRPGDHVEFSDFMGGWVGYYPGSLFDGCLIKTANKAHCAHSFLHVDYGVTREQVEKELSKENALLGYHSIGRVEWPYENILPNGGFKVPSEFAHFVKQRMYMNYSVQPFCIMEIYERNEDKDDSWGARRLALTYLFADGITAYYELFVSQYKKAPWIFLLQDHCLGCNYDKFGKGGILDKIIQQYDVLPHFVITDASINSMWNGFHLIEDVKAVIGGMHNNSRFLFQRNHKHNQTHKDMASQVKMSLREFYEAHGTQKDADETHPYPYIQMDCTIEELVEQTRAVSLDDFMRKNSDKYGI